MLELLRRKAQSPYLQATIVIIILVFIFWGVGTNTGNVQNSVATVNDVSISFQDYQKEYDQTFNSIRDQFGGNIPSGLIDSLNIKDQVLNKLVQTALLRQGAQEAGLFVSDQELRNSIQEMEAFKNNGFFDAQWYEQVLASSRMSVSKFEEGLRYDLLSAKAVDHLSRFVHPSDKDLQELFNNSYQKTKFDYAEFSAESFKDKVELTDEKLEAYFEENKTNYQAEPKARINYLLFPFDQVADLPEPSDEEIDKVYQNTLNLYTTPEKRNARHILFRTGESVEKDAEQKTLAQDVLVQINAGADFAEMAKEYSEDGSAARGGDLGFFQREQMVKPFADAAFALSEGSVSEIVESQFGYHIIKLEKIEPAAIKPLEEVRDRIVTQMQEEAKKVAPFDKANTAYEQIILSGSLAKYEEKLTEADNAPRLISTELFSQLAPPQELMTLPEIINAGFSLQAGELSSILETSQGYAIVSVEEKLAPEQQELSAVKDQVESDYTKSQSNALAKTAAEDLLKALKEGADFGEETKKLGIEIKSTPFVSRSDLSTATDTLPTEIIQESFTLSASTKYPEEVSSSGDSFYLVAFSERQDPDEGLFAEKKDAIKDQYIQQRNNDLISAWLEHLRREAEITTNPQLL